MTLETVLKALGDRNRLRIMNLLISEELCVCEIEEILGLSQTNVSRHLNKLSVAGLISSRKDAQWIFYKVSGDFIKDHGLLAEYLEAGLKKTKECRLDSTKLAKFKKESASASLLRCRQIENGQGL